MDRKNANQSESRVSSKTTRFNNKNSKPNTIDETEEISSEKKSSLECSAAANHSHRSRVHPIRSTTKKRAAIASSSGNYRPELNTVEEGLAAGAECYAAGQQVAVVGNYSRLSGSTSKLAKSKLKTFSTSNVAMEKNEPIKGDSSLKSRSLTKQSTGLKSRSLTKQSTGRGLGTVNPPHRTSGSTYVLERSCGLLLNTRNSSHNSSIRDKKVVKSQTLFAEKRKFKYSSLPFDSDDQIQKTSKKCLTYEEKKVKVSAFSKELVKSLCLFLTGIKKLKNILIEFKCFKEELSMLPNALGIMRLCHLTSSNIKDAICDLEIICNAVLKQDEHCSEDKLGDVMLEIASILTFLGAGREDISNDEHKIIEFDFKESVESIYENILNEDNIRKIKAILPIAFERGKEGDLFQEISFAPSELRKILSINSCSNFLKNVKIFTKDVLAASCNETRKLQLLVDMLSIGSRTEMKDVRLSISDISFFINAFYATCSFLRVIKNKKSRDTIEFGRSDAAFLFPPVVLKIEGLVSLFCKPVKNDKGNLGKAVHQAVHQALNNYLDSFKVELPSELQKFAKNVLRFQEIIELIQTSLRKIINACIDNDLGSSYVVKDHAPFSIKEFLSLVDKDVLSPLVKRIIPTMSKIFSEFSAFLDDGKNFEITDIDFEKSEYRVGYRLVSPMGKSFANTMFGDFQEKFLLSKGGKITIFDKSHYSKKDVGTAGLGADLIKIVDHAHANRDVYIESSNLISKETGREVEGLEAVSVQCIRDLFYFDDFYSGLASKAKNFVSVAEEIEGDREKLFYIEKIFFGCSDKPFEERDYFTINDIFGFVKTCRAIVSEFSLKDFCKSSKKEESNGELPVRYLEDFVLCESCIVNLMTCKTEHLGDDISFKGQTAPNQDLSSALFVNSALSSSVRL